MLAWPSIKKTSFGTVRHGEPPAACDACRSLAQRTGLRAGLARTRTLARPTSTRPRPATHTCRPRALPAHGAELRSAVGPPPACPPAAPHSVLGREPPRASKARGGLLPQNSELRLGIIYSVRCHLYHLYHRSYGSLSFISFACERVSPPSPTACDRMCRSMIACIAPRPRIYIN